MATGGELSLDDNVSCSLCFEFLATPYSLTCFHSFCENCVTKIQRVRDGNKIGVHCPMCRQFCLEQDVKANFVMKNLIEAYAKKVNISDDFPEGTRCIQCDNSDVTSFCVNCQVNLCRKCKNGHCRLPTFKNHEVIPIENKDTHERVRIDMFCTLHPDQEIKLCCKPCSKAICYECKVEFHDTHKTESVKAALERLLPFVKEKLRNIREKSNENHEILKKTKQHFHEHERAKEVLKQQVQKEIQRKIAIVQADGNKLLQEIDASNLSNEKELKLMVEGIEHKLSSQNSLLSWGETLTERAEGSGLLYELLDGLLHVLQSHSVDQDIVHTTQRTQVPSVKFCSTPLDVEANVVGTLLREQNEFVFLSGNASEEIQNTLTPCDTHKSIGTFKSFRHTDLVLENLNHNSFQLVSKFNLKRAADRICFHQDKLWIPNNTGGMIDIYTLEGKLHRTITSFKGMHVYDLHPLNYSQLLLASDESLCIIDNDGKLLSTIKQEKFMHVHVHDNIIAALYLENPDRNIRSVILIEKHTFETVIKFVVDSNAFQILVTDKYVYVMTPNEGSVPLTKYSLEGKVISQFGKHTSTHNLKPSVLYLPRLSMYDSVGSVLVPEMNNRRLQVLNPNGRWKPIFNTENSWFHDVIVTKDGIMFALELSWNITQYRITV